MKTFARCFAKWFVFFMFERAQLKSGFLRGGMAIVGCLNFLWISIMNDHQVFSLQFSLNVSFLA